VVPVRGLPHKLTPEVSSTIVAVACSGCSAVACLGEVRVFGGRMGAIFRCTRCNTAVVRLVRLPTGYSLDMRGARSLFVPGPRD
jgi:Family of unknown function (DUF6510)